MSIGIDEIQKYVHVLVLYILLPDNSLCSCVSVREPSSEKQKEWDM